MKNSKGRITVSSRIDFVRLASEKLDDAILVLIYDTTDERTTKSRTTLITYLLDIGMTTVAQAIEAHKSVVMFENPDEAIRVWQQISDHSHALGAHIFWHGLQDDAVHHAQLAARPKEVSPLAHH
ncbi:hypothetical protein HQ393_12920 [Chitinibacter bivalviorum]|uniref:Uncharacterized protein n=1 Tax=Chitinibacter bivalviorum TaxID=2739434 RepID=A0A7H9BKP8_9NEIS|nr:hypothetical protein [Chitinibacter bivalviorum]QLG89069.1 hypothetical protein HQ393_12920 [Chitinibacter bivalviorum]